MLDRACERVDEHAEQKARNDESDQNSSTSQRGHWGHRTNLRCYPVLPWLAASSRPILRQAASSASTRSSTPSDT